MSEIIEQQSLIIVCGSGGVGKTTISAAIALALARQGKKSIVVTIDPAKRLAQAMGLAHLSARPQKVTASVLEGMRGELWAMMLDAKTTFDELIVRYAPSSEIREKILKNRIYQHVSSSLAGSQEYMAIEEVCELARGEKFDVIVLDTPPTHHALDFLGAPQRMIRFLDEGVIKWFFKPYFALGRVGFSLLAGASGKVLRVLERLTGFEFLQDLSEFFFHFREMYDGFKERAQWVYDRLRSRDSVFVVVTAPERQSMRELKLFHRALKEGGMPFGGIIVNRVHLLGGGEELVEALNEGVPAELESAFEGVLEFWREYQGMVRYDARCLEELEDLTGRSLPIRSVPHFEEEISDLHGLDKMGGILFTEST
ncbi:MAG: ArsA family ATPase [Deltaproteobacteria bacterium]|nr:ArsA family ATPase [Deltaproteobacteria bacterium]